jgi:hypothetical protein
MLPEALDKMMSIPSFSSMDFSSFMRGLEGALELCVVGDDVIITQQGFKDKATAPNWYRSGPFYWMAMTSFLFLAETRGRMESST